MSQGFTRPEGPTGATGADGVGVPTGGTTGQVLEKVDATDYNTQWAAASATDADAIHDNVSGEIAAVTEKASPVSADLILIEDSAASNVKKRVQVGNLPGGSSSPLTTKGDLYGYDSADARLAIGTDDYVLTADSTQALGLKWAAAASGASPLTTKGDLHGYSTVDARLPVGTDDQVLTADSAETLGVKWAAAGGGQSVPVWMEHLADRTAGGETVHADDQEFTGTIGGTAATPTGTVTWTQERGVLSAVFNSVGSGDAAVRLFSLTPTTTPVTIETALRVFSTTDGYTMVGVAFADGTATTSNAAVVTLDNTSQTYKKRHGTIANLATGSTGDIYEASGYGLLYLRLVWTAANTFKSSVSVDGVSWTNFSDDASISKTMTPTHFGVLVTNWGNLVKQVASFEYLRVTESDLSI